jgi:C1A family cysteine protease
MRKLIRFQSQCLSIVLVLMVLLPCEAFSSGDIEQIKQAIIEKGARWTAGESWVTRLSFKEQKQLCGARIDLIDPGTATLISLPKLISPPAVFDWRDNNGNWMTPVKNQGWTTPWMNRTCGSCWDFAGVAAIEAWWKIHHAEPDSQIDLSEQFILSCGELDCWSGGTVEYVYDFARTMGIPTEACFPYRADDSIPCDSACANWQDEAVTIPGYGYITWDKAKIENLKSAVFRRPVAASLNVYQDFLYYKEGVYEHVWGDFLYGHAVVITGWNDDEQSWICKNSFGTSWGDGGYFRIKWGECEIGTYCPYIWDDLTEGPVLATTPAKFDLALVSGDSLVDSLTIKNIGSKPLEYSILDMGATGDPADWMDVAEGQGVLAEGEEAVAKLLIGSRGLEPGEYQGMLVIVYNDTTTFVSTITVELQVLQPVNVQENPVQVDLPKDFLLQSNYPNPFNPSTTIEFALPKSAFVTLKVYNLLGEEVATLVAEQRSAGIHKLNWDARGLASGVYLYRMEAGDFVQVKKLILMR